MSTRYSALFLLAALSCTAPAFAQQNVASGQTSGSIHLDVVVTPKSGVPVAGLKQQDFTVLDNKVAQTITSFQAVAGGQTPVDVILLVDGVNTPYLRLAYAREEIDKFLRANGGHLAHPVSLAILTDTGTQIEDAPSSDGNALSSLLDQSSIGLRSIRRSNGIYGADEQIQLSLQTLRRLAAREAERPGRKIILWLSPGWPMLSGPHIELTAKQEKQIFAEVVDMSTALREARITLYSVDPLGAGVSILGNDFYYEGFVKGVTKSNGVMPGDLSLQVIATQTGGLVLHSSNDISSLLQRAMADTSAYYEISFKPPPAERADEYHHLEVKMADPGLTARTRQGYYSRPQ